MPSPVRQPLTAMLLPLLLIALFALPACTSLDPRPFAESTHLLRQAMAAAGDAATATFDDLAAATTDPAERSVIRAQATEFKTQWRSRLAMIDAAADYARSLEKAIAQRLHDRAAVRLVAQSLHPLLALHAAGPPLASLALTAHETLADLAAADSITDAVHAAAPIIESITILLSDDLAALAIMHRANRAALEAVAAGPPPDPGLPAIQLAQQAVSVWRDTHRALAASLQAGRRIDHRLLQQRVEAIGQAINTLAPQLGVQP